MTKRSVHVSIQGRVQGVFFRESTRQQANVLGVSGWVRNCFDGSVEAMLEGEEQKVEEMLTWLHHGPATARVDTLQWTESEPENVSFPFEVRY
ncbi:MAG: acylphosphatase [Desulfobulbus propionicus]|nr:MAG: acylphosphatase [Desulfobulbus propionicus]